MPVATDTSPPSDRIPVETYWPTVGAFAAASGSPPEESASALPLSALVERAASLLAANQHSTLPAVSDKTKLRGSIDALLTVRHAEELEAGTEAAEAVDALLAADAQKLRKEGRLVDVSSLKPMDGEPRLFLHKGDITLLSDLGHPAPSLGIVNAANHDLIGCHRLDHPCIDNQIHLAAGPLLRDACAAYSKKFRGSHGEPAGTAVVTPSFSLRHRGITHVLHTVGPKVSGTIRPHDPERLEGCYRSLLDASREAGIRNLAICAVSTGVFGYPVKPAAEVAARAVRGWLAENASELPAGVLERIVIDCFSKSDTEHYATAFGVPVPEEPAPPPELAAENPHFYTTPPHGLLPDSLDRAAAILKDADAVIISAGAGLSASAGLDYLDGALFKAKFPWMHSHGLRKMYDFIGWDDWPDDGRAMWAYLLSQIALEASWPASKAYRLAREIAAGSPAPESSGRPYFVFTTNTDGFFALNGYPPELLCEAQGLLSRLQCALPCRHDAVWPAAVFSAALADVDPSTGEIRDPALVPKCKFCGGACRPNINDGDAWLGEAYLRPRAAFASFVRNQRSAGAKVAILELGMGFNSPAVARLPMEAICAAWGQKGWCRMVRVNQERWEVPRPLAEAGSVGIGADAGEALRELHGRVFRA
ncbi:hypothetical protein DFJ74DRAFT_771463 [Hyaloraphidium curvatum]|nr:hypothetical protein DFJ74DRAFT_771463 [Hyaloraphidium curvatum]